VEVEGGTQDQRVIFYTALYHSLIAPNIFSDVDGRYRGMDHRIHRAGGRRRYTVFSLWDTFRATHPLFTILEPARTREFIETFLAQYREGGRLPVWELAANETDTMIGITPSR
jgi:putative alpha-1,2-mannosidase